MGDEISTSMNRRSVPVESRHREKELFIANNEDGTNPLAVGVSLGSYGGTTTSSGRHTGKQLASTRNSRDIEVSALGSAVRVDATTDGPHGCAALSRHDHGLDLAIGVSHVSRPCSSASRSSQAAGKEVVNDAGHCDVGDNKGFVLPERDDSGHDFQHKRAKVAPVSDATTTLGPAVSALSSERGHELFSMCLPSEIEMIHHFSSLINDSECGFLVDFNDGNFDGRGPRTSKSEDMEIKMDLTDDLLHMVFSFLGHIDLCRAAGVCQQWRAASAHEDFWMFLNFEDRKISLVQFEEICNRYPKATEVNILGTPSVDELSMQVLSSLRNIEILTVGKGELFEDFFQALSNCHALKRLVISEASLGNGIQDISLVHDKLRHLQIVKCRTFRISLRCPQLETLSLRRTNMAHASLNCVQLRVLNISFCHKLSDVGIRSAVTSCLSLTSLDISHCLCVSDETLREIAENCSYLRVLNASYCPNISLESVRLHALTDLKLEHCEGITSASMTSIAVSHMLEALELDCCGLLTAVSLDLSHLRRIMLRHCRTLADLNLRSHVLSSISVSNCGALHRISIVSSSLKKLILQKQESLATLSLECQCLQEVDLTDCESLTNSICDVFSDGGGCPMIRSLVLDNCESLTTVGLKSSTLVDVSLVGCRGMTALYLVCPNLENIQLDGCDHLETASFSPVGLQALNLGICPKLSTIHIEASLMTVLELKGCGVLSHVVINCPLLKSLDASFCSQLTDECLSATTSSCPLIESLILMSCPSVGLKGLFSLRWLPNLTLLDLSYTFLMSLQPVFETCLQLKVLKLQACKYLTNSSLDALHKGALPALCELDLSYGTICQSSMEELLASCTHLTHVSLNGCVNMHDLDWGSSGLHFSNISNKNELAGSRQLFQQPDRSLQSLNFVGCPNIKKVVIPFIAGCHHLSMLNLSLSANLKEVDLNCPNLTFLNLSNCCSLEILKLQCPRLISLFLLSCIISESGLENAVLDCSMIETLDIRFCPKIHAACMSRLRTVCPSLKRIFNSLSS